MYSGGATGTHTPRSSQNLRPLILTHGSLEYSFLIATSLHYQASQLKDTFNATLPEPTDELAQDDEPSSNAELVARFIGFIAAEVEEEDEGATSFMEVLKTVINEFERAFMRANDIHALAASLPGITAKKLLVVKCYYAGRAAVSRPIKPHDSALLRAADDEEASIYTVFGGQGNIEEYFDELREAYTTYPSFVRNLIESSADLLKTLSSSPEADKFYSKGLDIIGWLENRDAQPDTDYLVSAPVSFPLIGLVQLAHYQVICKALGKTPGEVNERFNGTTGHSQGVVTAAVIASATSW